MSAVPADSILPVTPASPVPPHERIPTLDLVRGLAVLGILVMNVVEFGLPMAAYEDPRHAGGQTGLDLWTWLLQQTLFDGKMRALFSMLFGAGLVLIDEQLVRAGRAGIAADVLLRRCLWLAAFGVVHRFGLQWTGDILYAYGLLGLLAIAARRVRPAALWAVGLALIAAFTPIGLWKHHQAAKLRDQAVQATALAAAGEPVPTPLQEAKTRWERRLAPPQSDAHTAEVEAIRGGYPSVFAYRWDHHHAFQSAFLYYYFVFDVLGMVFVGMALCRQGFFAGNWSTRAYAITVGLGVLGALATGWWAMAFAAAGFSPGELELRLLHEALHPLVRGVTGLAWAAALLLVHRAGWLATLCARLIDVGRMAFTNYVLQTVCCTLLFFGYGLGWFGSLSRAAHLLVWAGVTGVQVLLSWWWLRQFRSGPLEWLWRSLVWWQRQPFRR